MANFGEGLVQGFGTGAGVVQRNRQLGQQDRQLEQAQQQARRDQLQGQLDVVNQTLDAFRSTVTEAAKNVGPERAKQFLSDPRFQAQIAQAVEVRNAFMSQLGFSGGASANAEEVIAQMTRLADTQPSAADKGIRAGEEARAGLTARLGREPTQLEVERDAGVEGPAVNTQNFIGPNGERALVDLNAPDAGERVRRLGEAGFLEVGINVQPSDAEGIASVFGDRATKAAGSAAGTAVTGAAVEAVELGTELTQLRGLTDQLSRVGAGGVGIRGLLAEKGGGILGQLNKGLGENFTRAVAGASEEDIQGLRTEMITTMSSFIPETTGEESGRFTEAERELAKEATRLLKTDANFAQIKAAVGALTKLKIISRQKELFLSGQPLDYDTSTPQGQDDALIDFLDSGLSPQQAADLTTAIIRMQGLIKTNPLGLGISPEFLPGG